MRLVTISDTHGMHYLIGKTSPSLPAGDVIIHAGDLTGRGRLYELIEFANWFGGLDYDHKICIAGNHDEVAQNMGANNVKDLFWEHGVVYLCDTTYVLDGIHFYGTPYTPEFCGWSFMLDEHNLSKKYNLIPDNTDILISHGPAYGILDDKKGSVSLKNRINELNLKAWVFGHIHGGRGRQENYVNASFLDDNYNPYNETQEVITI